ncbi:hypothetical protein D0867_15841 [Hortaea werneckii]|uniref:Uncharacterized protein n=1 Tax=Hortaea werneckii TaxID=91943 RepID=A0A3M6X4C2_HORWE|nr:hypothetical protein D0867_15841 [Hortaea werneckii]
MIDDPRNRANIAQSIERRALFHLQNLVDSTYNFTGVPFPDALSSWLATRGVPRTPQDRLIDLWTFAEIWLSQHPPLPDETGRQDRWMLLYGTRKAASALLGVHLRLHFPEVYDKSEFEGRYGGWRDEQNLFWIYLDGFGPQVKRAYGWNDEMPQLVEHCGLLELTQPSQATRHQITCPLRLDTICEFIRRDRWHSKCLCQNFHAGTAVPRDEPGPTTLDRVRSQYVPRKGVSHSRLRKFDVLEEAAIRDNGREYPDQPFLIVAVGSCIPKMELQELIQNHLIDRTLLFENLGVAKNILKQKIFRQRREVSSIKIALLVMFEAFRKGGSVPYPRVKAFLSWQEDQDPAVLDPCLQSFNEIDFRAVKDDSPSH